MIKVSTEAGPIADLNCCLYPLEYYIIVIKIFYDLNKSKIIYRSNIRNMVDINYFTDI